MQRKLTTEEKIQHINRCEFHRETKPGKCPIISIQEAKELREIQESK